MNSRRNAMEQITLTKEELKEII
ncbi:hypothetical protein W192_02432, partial [Staphylococcus aureus DAR3919]